MGKKINQDAFHSLSGLLHTPLGLSVQEARPLVKGVIAGYVWKSGGVKEGLR